MRWHSVAVGATHGIRQSRTLFSREAPTVDLHGRRSCNFVGFCQRHAWHATREGAAAFAAFNSCFARYRGLHLWFRHIYLDLHQSKTLGRSGLPLQFRNWLAVCRCLWPDIRNIVVTVATDFRVRFDAIIFSQSSKASDLTIVCNCNFDRGEGPRCQNYKLLQKCA